MKAKPETERGLAEAMRRGEPFVGVSPEAEVRAGE